jgi:nicotinamidase-related amidase
MKCLLIIDAQEAWRDKKLAFYLGDLKEFISTTNKLIAWARQNKIPIIFSLHKFKADSSDILKQERGTNLEEFIDGRSGAELISALDQRDDDIILIKNRFSVFSNPELDKILQRGKIDELIIGGLITNCCVRATVVDAYNREYVITIIKEACASNSKETDEFTFRDLRFLHFGLKIKSVEDFK